MSKQISIYFEEDNYSNLGTNIKLNDDIKSITGLCKKLLREEYINKDRPTVFSKKRRVLDDDKNYQKYNLRIDKKLYKQLAYKMNEQKDKYINNLVIQLLEQNGYFNDPTIEN